VSRAIVVLLLLASCALPTAPAQEPASAAGNWPQWRGPRRDNISDEKGILTVWPEDGPALFWEVQGIGGGIAAVAVQGGRVFTVGYLGDSEYLSALEEGTGRRLWTSRLGPAVMENALMRWLGQRTPTVDGDRVYAFHTEGTLVCFDTATGKERWRKDYLKEFGSQKYYWGLCDRPLVDGDKLICSPGGTVAMLALDKKTGALLWKSDVRGRAAHSAAVISEAAGVRQYVTCFSGKMVGVRASDGKLLWTEDDFGRTANSCTPIPVGDSILGLSGYGVPLIRLKLTACGDGMCLEKPLEKRMSLSPFQDSALLFGKDLFLVGGRGTLCLDAETGEMRWTEAGPGRGLASMIGFPGHLIVHQSDGTVSLVDATREKCVVVSSFGIAGWQTANGSTNPVLTGGRLYLRNESRLLCFDVRENPPVGERRRPPVLVLPSPDPKATPAPATQAVYVPTPQDVVEKMLELVHVGPEDLVYDLGSGDGRILITAAKKHDARALGFEIDAQLVRESRDAIEKAGVKDRVSVEEKDLFTADLSPAKVIALYLPEPLLTRLAPALEKLPAGVRIVSHQFRIPGYRVDAAQSLKSKEDGESHAVYVWTTPLRKEKE
jgi:outer membrane protein assembly factor BamB